MIMESIEIYSSAFLLAMVVLIIENAIRIMAKQSASKAGNTSEQDNSALFHVEPLE